MKKTAKVSPLSAGPPSGGSWTSIPSAKEDKPVYFHCSVGADRTGSIAFLIGALCGMSEDQLAKEFELTSFSADYVITNGKAEDLRRRRTYEGRYDNNEEDN